LKVVAMGDGGGCGDQILFLPDKPNPAMQQYFV
jgi:hypothetical protein